jgi:hypothetical protein
MSFDNFININICKNINELETILEKTKDITIQGTQSAQSTIYITIYHIHIGSKTHFYIGNQSNSHNHEYTNFLKTLFNEPLKQFSPELISKLEQYPEINIKNIVILIDPMYNNLPVLEGFKEFKDLKILNNEQIIQHCNNSLTIIKINIEIIQYSNNITEEEIINLVKIINNNSILINIIDCTSRLLLEYYAYCINSLYSHIYITRPDCLLNDILSHYNPIITLTNKTLTNNTKQLIRWMNYTDDLKLIPELKEVIDICYSSNITYIFLTESYKYNIALENLISIVKLWSRLSYTNIQEIQLSGYNNSDNNSDNNTKNIIYIKFCDLSFIDFIKYWKMYGAFSDFILSTVDFYYKYNFKIYVDKFIMKYENKENSVSIVDALKIDAYQIFQNLLNYCKYDREYIIENIKSIESIERKHIMDYLKFNNIHL